MRYVSRMTTDPILNGLANKRAEILRDITIAKDSIAMLEADLASIEGAIRVFDPDVTLRDSVKRVPALHAAPEGQMARHIFTCLRQADKPLKTIEVTEFVMQARGIDPRDKRMRQNMVDRTYAALGRLKKAGQVRQTDDKGHRRFWVMVGDPLAVT